MHPRALKFVVVGIAFMGALAGAALWLGQAAPPTEQRKSVESGSMATPAVIFATSYEDLAGNRQSLGQWSGKLLVINFWASWCAPCLEEMPLFVAAQGKYGAQGLQIIGIAADSRQNSAKFAEKLRVNYPVFPDESGAIAFSKRAGNRFGFLPYTLVISPSGDVLTTKLGVFTAAELDELITKNLPTSSK
jgi:thiol-disulfide isomerase/thioredoxin